LVDSQATVIPALTYASSGSDIAAHAASLYLVDGLATPRTATAKYCVFKHVVLRGKIGEIMITDYVGEKPRLQRAFDEANAAYYANVDWALDIREADCRDVDLRGMPARLVIRDPATQVVVTRERALKGAWSTADLARTHWPGAIARFLEDNRSPAMVLAAPKRDRNYPELLEGLQKLRELGVAEPD
jgi:hypothetical protein